MFECGSSGDSNAAARVVTLSPKFCHITPVLVNLHWLPIDLRIEFKMLTVTYKTLHGLILILKISLILKIFFKVTSRQRILGLQKKKICLPYVLST